MAALIGQYGYRSVLDVGAGTGRGLIFLKSMFPELRVVGVEPSPELRQIGHDKGLSQVELIDGDALDLAFENGSFDLVCEFAVLHHVKYPRQMLGEMLRVAKHGLFVSDDNHFAERFYSKPVRKACTAEHTSLEIGLLVTHWRQGLWYQCRRWSFLCLLNIR